VQLDRRNAFNSLSRQKMLYEVAQRCPALLPLAAWACQLHSRLPLRGRPDATILSTRGPRQEDPLGPLFFALAMQGPLEELQQLALPVRPVAYAEGAFLQGSTAWVTAAIPILCDLAEPWDLGVVLGKCAAHSVAAELASCPWASTAHTAFVPSPGGNQGRNIANIGVEAASPVFQGFKLIVCNAYRVVRVISCSWGRRIEYWTISSCTADTHQGPFSRTTSTGGPIRSAYYMTTLFIYIQNHFISVRGSINPPSWLK
jgi:hypothetical protein